MIAIQYRKRENCESRYSVVYRKVALKIKEKREIRMKDEEIDKLLKEKKKGIEESTDLFNAAEEKKKLFAARVVKINKISDKITEPIIRRQGFLNLKKIIICPVCRCDLSRKEVCHYFGDGYLNIYKYFKCSNPNCDYEYASLLRTKSPPSSSGW
jgi:predicted RNase H-like nuclease (RuvC/YqgF family)